MTEVINGFEPVRYQFNYRADALFYDGNIWFEDGKRRRASFVPFKEGLTYPEQKIMVDKIFYESSKVNHAGLLKPWFVASCLDKEMHLICYERFDAFLTEDWFRNHQNGMQDRHGNPLPWVQSSIRDTMEAVRYILKNHLFHMNLGVMKSYVVVDDVIKIINLEGSWEDLANPEQLEQGKDIETLVSANQFKPLITQDIKAIKKVWKKLLATKNSWKERDRFLACFDLNIDPWYVLMEKIITYPFLKTAEERIRSFSQIHRQFVTKSLPRQNVFDQAITTASFGPYRHTLQTVVLSSYLCGVLTFPGSKTYTGSIPDLLRFLRAAYEHRDAGFKVVDMDNEVRKHWDGLLELLHEKM